MSAVALMIDLSGSALNLAIDLTGSALNLAIEIVGFISKIFHYDFTDAENSQCLGDL